MEKEDAETVLDLSGKKIKQLERAPVNQLFATALVLDNNNLQNLSNLDSYGELERLSIANNKIVRMYWFSRMYSLRILNLPNNNIVQIEGMKELHHLVHLNLSGNNLKNLDGLSHSHKLEHLNVSGNYINQLNDLSILKNLKELFLHRNRLVSLHRYGKCLPSSLFILTLSDNCISDLNEFCILSHLVNLEQFTCLNNPCLDAYQQIDQDGVVIGPPLAFDYRPFIINWCLNLKVLDGYKIAPKESLKGEWLYSQGKGRGFQVGEHGPLVHYLSGICLAGGGWGGADLPDDDEKLAKILQLAKLHQQELRHSSSVNGQDQSDTSSGCGSRDGNQSDSTSSQRKDVQRSGSLRRTTGYQRMTKKVVAENCRPDVSHLTKNQSHSRKSNSHDAHNLNSQSYHVELSSTLYGGELKTPDTPGLMTQSMDPSLLSKLSSEDPDNFFNDDQMSQSIGPEFMLLSSKREKSQLSIVKIEEDNQQVNEDEVVEESTHAISHTLAHTLSHTLAHTPASTSTLTPPILSPFLFAMPSTSRCAFSDSRQEKVMPHRKNAKKNLKRDASPLYEAPIDRLSRKNFEKDRFDVYCKGWAIDLREINKTNPSGALNAKRLFDKIIFKAHRNEINENTKIMNVLFNDELGLNN